jgi:hypothetical protein
MTEIAESEFPALFAHGTRKDWGVGVLAGERDGKRSYLFEGGEERIMGSGAYDMMRKISPLDAEQQATLGRLVALVARRQGRPDPSKSAAFSLLEQLETLHKTFPTGFKDPEWQSESRAGRARGEILAEAQELLSLKAIEAHLKAQQFEAVWAAATKVMRATQWLPADQLRPLAPGAAVQPLAGAVRELLYGSGALEQRVDRFVAAYEVACGRAPRWETATALLALVFPADHVLVELASFRKQLKALGAKGTLATRPAGVAYARCGNAARIVFGKLAESGEVPQDLLDVSDFVRFTLKPVPPAARAKAAKTAKAAKKPKAKAEDAEDSEESSDDSE